MKRFEFNGYLYKVEKTHMYGHYIARQCELDGEELQSCGFTNAEAFDWCDDDDNELKMDEAQAYIDRLFEVY